MNCTTTVRGIKVRTRTTRRFAVAFVRYERMTTGEGYVYEPGAEIERRTDNIYTAETHIRNRGRGGGNGWVRVIIDTTTGEEV